MHDVAFNFFAHFTFYTACLCAASLAIGVYCLLDQVNSEFVLDGWIIAVLVLSAFFGLFSFGMALTAGRFIFINITNIEMLRKSNTVCLAVRIPLDTPPSNQYQTISYPLQPPQLVPQQEANPRDQLATRKFAILRTKPRENPWDLGIRRNWESVMGDSVLEWLLPLRRSPCCNHESMVSDYPLGAVLSRMKKRYEVPDLGETGNGIEMQQRT